MENSKFRFFVFLFSTLLAVAVLIGWRFDIDILKTLIPNVVSMKLNTAIGFLLISMVGFLIDWKLPIRNFFIYSFSISLSLLGLLNIVQYYFLLDFGIDQYFSMDFEAIRLGNKFPGRMAENTAISFFIFGIASILGFSKKRFFLYISQFLFSIIITISLLSILGYLYGIPEFTRFFLYNSMAIHASILFIITSMAFLTINKNLGVVNLFMATKIGNITARWIFPSFAILIIILGYFRIVMNRNNFHVEFGIVIFVVSLIILVLILIWVTTNKINKIDAKRYIAEQEIKNTNAQLEVLIQERTKELDITFLKLQKSSEQNKIFVQQSPIAMAMFDKNMHYLAVSEKWNEEFNFEEINLIGQSHFLVFKSISEFININPQLALSGEVVKKEAEYAELPNGTSKWVSWEMRPWFIMEGQIGGILISVLNIDAIKKAELELKGILESAHVSIIGTDLKGTITHFNKGAELMLGYSREEIIGKNHPTIFHLEEEIIERSQELGEEFRIDISGFEVLIYKTRLEGFEARKWTYIKKDGEKFSVQLVVSAIKDSNGNLIGYLGIATDISRLEKIQSFLRDSKKHLELVTEKLKYQNIQLTEFSQITSHNLRSPVGNLASLINLYKETETEEEKDILFSYLEKVSNLLMETLNELMNALRIKEIGIINLEPIQVNESYENVRQILADKILNCNAQINLNFDSLPTVIFNKIYFENILLNLISNSLKYRSPDRNLIITIHTKLQNGVEYLEIEDNGLGIDLEKNKDKIFGLYKTFHKHKEAKGLGLFLVKTEVMAMGGDIQVESTLGKCTKFIVSLGEIS